MQTKYKSKMRALWKLAGEIGTKGETDTRYAEVYGYLCRALDAAEAHGLIVTAEDESDESTKQKKTA